MATRLGSLSRLHTCSTGSLTRNVFSISIAIALIDHAFLLENVPHLPRRNRHINVLYAKMGKCVDHGIDEGRRRADIRRLAHALGAEGMMRRRRAGLACLPVRSLDRRGYQV